MIPKLPPVASNLAGWIRDAARTINLLISRSETPPATIPMVAGPLPALGADDRVLALDEADDTLKFWDGTQWNALW